MNKVILMGRLTKDPEMRYSQSNEPLAITKYTIAVNRRFKQGGEQDADFIPCTVFGKSAEFAEKYFKKGQQITISGRLQISSFDDKDGKRVWYTDVIVEEQEFAESKQSFESRGNAGGFDNSYNQAPQPTQNTQKSSSPQGFSSIAESIDDEDLPF